MVTLVKMGRCLFGLPVFVSVQCWPELTSTEGLCVGSRAWRAKCAGVAQELGSFSPSAFKV